MALALCDDLVCNFMLGTLALVVAYLLGAIPFGYLLVRFTKGADIRASGSGNIGATNVLRTAGKAEGIATLALDIAKGFVAVWIAVKLTDNSPLWTALAALAVMAGHAFPVFLQFKGGKAVASFIGAFLCLTPIPLLVSLLLFVVVVAKTKHISAGSIVAAGTFPFAVWMILHPAWEITAAAFIAGAFVVYRHSANIERLREGRENVFRWRMP
jgi:glycerol-3-phosphate acyltransferase PlsY